MLLREVYKLEPFLEYGFDVAINLLLCSRCGVTTRSSQRRPPTSVDELVAERAAAGDDARSAVDGVGAQRG